MVTIKHRKTNYTIAIDPGTHFTGVAIFNGYQFDDSFSIRNPYKTNDGDLRSYNIINLLEEKIRAFVRCPGCFKYHATLAYENPQYFKGKGGGRPIESVIRMAAMLSFWGMASGFNVYKHSVSTVKAGVGGSAHSNKASIERIMVDMFDLTDVNRTDHEYDAMSVGVYHLNWQDPNCFGVALPVLEQ